MHLTQQGLFSALHLKPLLGETLYHSVQHLFFITTRVFFMHKVLFVLNTAVRNTMLTYGQDHAHCTSINSYRSSTYCCSVIYTCCWETFFAIPKHLEFQILITQQAFVEALTSGQLHWEQDSRQMKVVQDNSFSKDLKATLHPFHKPPQRCTVAASIHQLFFRLVRITNEKTAITS